MKYSNVGSGTVLTGFPDSYNFATLVQLGPWFPCFNTVFGWRVYPLGYIAFGLPVRYMGLWCVNWLAGILALGCSDG